MSSTTTEAEEFARLALGSRALKNRRVRRAIIARLLNENGETNNGDDTEETEEGGDNELVRALIGSRILRRRRVRRALLAHLLQARNEGETDEGETEDTFEEEGGDEGEILKLLIASRALRRRRVRRALVAHLLSAKAEGGEETGDEGFDDDSEDDPELVRALIASRMLRRRRVRRVLLAHLLKEHHEATV